MQENVGNLKFKNKAKLEHSSQFKFSLKEIYPVYNFDKID